jgi:hypothetical protein
MSAIYLPARNLPALEEAISINLFSEYKALNKYKNDSDYQMGRFLIYKAIIDIIKFDPEKGDMKEHMSPTDKIIWKNIYQTIKDGATLLSKNDRMACPLLWTFIPDRFKRIVDMNFDNIGGWRS